MTTASSSSTTSDFPIHRLVPKDETCVTEFLNNVNSKYDGRDVIVAIFDTGVDPGAIGLQTTTTNQVKVIDTIDATGSGDINMSKRIQVEDTTKNTIIGLSGKELKLNIKEWINPTNEYRLGIKSAYELFPKSLIERMKKERKDKLFNKQHRQSIYNVQEELKQFKLKYTKPTSEQVEQYQNLLDQMTLLQDYDKKFMNSNDGGGDVGPIYDCISWYDGTNWNGIVDTTNDGDLTKVKPMKDYKINYEYNKLDNRSQMNYALKFYDNGNIMSIVCDAGAHGSHVAGIVSAYHPNETSNNGVAPGAQIVSIKIGDSRLGSMETGTGLIRGLISCIENNVDIINMSYGEFSTLHNSGRFIELTKEIVNEHNIIFISSAGNEGPALSTVGAPGGTTSCILGVGAYVSPAMMDTEYTMKQTNINGLGIPYTWSSRGPTFDGDYGVNICAPGGAITSVPNWTLSKCKLMNGTSMSSPNCAGNVALLVSALKQQNINYNPYFIKRSLENTALKLNNVEEFAQGRGLIQVTKAYNYLMKYSTIDGNNQLHPLYYNISTIYNNKQQRGIYLREEIETYNNNNFTISVNPIFHKHAPQESKVNFEKRIKLISTVSWVIVGEHLELMYGGRTFTVSVLCEQLLPNKEYFGEIIAYDSTDINRDAILFRVPITIIKPLSIMKQQLQQQQQQLDYYSTNTMTTTSNNNNNSNNSSIEEWKTTLTNLCPGTIKRHFITIPKFATWITISIKRIDNLSASRLYMIHLLQLIPHLKQSKTSLEKAFRLESTNGNSNDSKSATYSLSVQGGTTIEICLAQYWSSMDNSSIEMKCNFYGIIPDSNCISLHGGLGYQRIMVRNELRTIESVLPIAKLTNWLQRIRPMNDKSGICAPLLEPLSNDGRDILPNGRQIYQLILTYKLNKVDDGDIITKFPLLNELLYESPYESQLCMIFDTNKRYINTSDAFSNSKIKLTKGEYYIKIQIRHDELEKLNKLKNMILIIDNVLKDTIPLSIYNTLPKAIIGNTTDGIVSKAKTIKKGMNYTYYITEPSYNKLPKGISSGDIITGNITYREKNSNNIEYGSTTKPNGGFQLYYTIPPEESIKDINTKPEVSTIDIDNNDNDTTTTSTTNNNNNKRTTEDEKTNDAIRDLRIDRLKKLISSSSDKEKELEFNKSFETLCNEYPNHVPLLLVKLDMVVNKAKTTTTTTPTTTRIEKKDNDKEDDTTTTTTTLVEDDIISAADAIINAININELKDHFGLQIPSNDLQGQKERKEKLKLKETLLEAYMKKGIAICNKLKLVKKDDDSTTTTTTKPEEEKVKEKEEEDDEAKVTTTTTTTKTEEKDDNDNDKFNKLYIEFQKWDDPTKSDKYIIFYIEYLLLHKFYGTALNKLIKFGSSSSSSGEGSSSLDKKERIKLLNETKRWDLILYCITNLNWNHIISFIKNDRILRFPESYRPF